MEPNTMLTQNNLVLLLLLYLWWYTKCVCKLWYACKVEDNL